MPPTQTDCRVRAARAVGHRALGAWGAGLTAQQGGGGDSTRRGGPESSRTQVPRPARGSQGTDPGAHGCQRRASQHFTPGSPAAPREPARTAGSRALLPLPWGALGAVRASSAVIRRHSCSREGLASDPQPPSPSAVTAPRPPSAPTAPHRAPPRPAPPTAPCCALPRPTAPRSARSPHHVVGITSARTDPSQAALEGLTCGHARRLLHAAPRVCGHGGLPAGCRGAVRMAHPQHALHLKYWLSCDRSHGHSSPCKRLPKATALGTPLPDAQRGFPSLSPSVAARAPRLPALSVLM